MYQGEYYLHPKDLMFLMGTKSLQYARRRHLKLRREVGKAVLSIRDYCQLTGDDYTEIYQLLRGTPPPTPPSPQKTCTFSRKPLPLLVPCPLCAASIPEI